jgi:hypothetical protein
MDKKNMRKRISIVLFKEKTGEIVKTMCFRKSGDFEYFLEGFKKMRYPGYKWRYAKK